MTLSCGMLYLKVQGRANVSYYFFVAVFVKNKKLDDIIRQLILITIKITVFVVERSQIGVKICLAQGERIQGEILLYKI